MNIDDNIDIFNYQSDFYGNVIAMPDELQLDPLNDLMTSDFTIEDLMKIIDGNKNIFHYVAKHFDFDKVEEFIFKVKEKGFSIAELLMHKSDAQKTPLHLAAEHDNPKFFDLFIKVCSNEIRQNPLHKWAIQKDKVLIGNFLENCRDDECRIRFLNVPDKDLNTPFSLALKDENLIRECLESFRYAQNRFNFITEKLDFLEEDEEYLFMLFESTDLTPHQIDGFLSCFSNHPIMLKTLLLKCNENYSTPFHLVVESLKVDNIKKVIDFIKLLSPVEQEAIYLSKDSGSHTPFHIVAYIDSKKTDRKTILPLIYNSAPEQTQKKMLESTDVDKNNIFHLLACHCDQPFSENFKDNCKKVFGKLMVTMKLKIPFLRVLSNVENDKNEKSLDIIPNSNDSSDSE
jgi:hypothetical protein